MERIAGWIAHVLEAPGDEERIAGVREEVRELCSAFQLYADFQAAG